MLRRQNYVAVNPLKYKFAAVYILSHVYKLFISVINQLDAQNFSFTISLVHASTCFEHMCPKHVET